MGSKNSTLFVLAAVSFPVEEVECPGDWGGPQDATWRGGRGGGVVPVEVPFKQGERAAPADWVSK